MKRELPSLRVLGSGAVGPGGLGVAALLRAPPAVTREPLLSEATRTVPVRRVDLSALASWSTEPRLRRASPLALFLAEAARQALAGVPAFPPGRLGLVAALGTGSIRFTRVFYERTLAKGRAQAAPAVFPETVYNSPVSHVASLLGIEGACYTVVGDESAWVGALRIAQVWLSLGTADAVLVVAGEELDAIALEAYAGFGWFRRRLVATEGASAVLVARADDASGAQVRPATTTWPFRSAKERRLACDRLTAESPFTILTTSGQEHGFAFTASAAWSFLQALERRRTGAAFRLLVAGSNAAVSAIDFP